MYCPSIGLLVAVSKSANDWRVRNLYLVETIQHFSIQKIQLLDLTGDDIDDLVIESSFGGALTAGSTLQVFDLSRDGFEELLQTNSWLEYDVQEGYTQFLDAERTKKTQGRQFCVSKTMLFQKGHWFEPPHISQTCYSRGYGVDREEARKRNHMLAPTH